MHNAKQMRWLILSCNTGAEHNSCARAIHDYIIEHGVECDVEDTKAEIYERITRELQTRGT